MISQFPEWNVELVLPSTDGCSISESTKMAMPELEGFSPFRQTASEFGISWLKSPYRGAFQRLAAPPTIPRYYRLCEISEKGDFRAARTRTIAV